MSGGEQDGFLQRWSRRKAQVRRGTAEQEPPPPPAVPPVAATSVVATSVVALPGAAMPVAATPASPAAGGVLAPATDTGAPPASAPPAEPPPALPTMEDVGRLTRDSDYSRFVGAGVDRSVSNAAMRKLFSDPHFNVMDGLDVYIDDYGKPDPIPESMLRQLNQSKLLRLFEVEEDAAAGAADPATAAVTDGGAHPTVAQSCISTPVPPPPLDDDPDLRLQQDDAPGRPGPGPGAGA